MRAVWASNAKSIPDKPPRDSVRVAGPPLCGHSALTHRLQHATREALFDRLHDPRGIAFLRLADQEMNMVRHDHIAHGHEAITLADFLHDCQKQVSPPRAGQPALPMITTASDEMQFVRAVITPGMVRHKANLRVAARKSCDIRPSRPHLYKKRKGGPATRH
jgi:hypothetical protein